MSKDLRQQFDAYFDGASVPENLAEDAKKAVRPRTPMRTVWIKTACAAACALFVCAMVGVALFSDEFSANFSPNSPESSESGGVAGSDQSADNDFGEAGESSGGENPAAAGYPLASLSRTQTDPIVAAQENPKLKLYALFPSSSDCSAKNMLIYADEDQTVLASADITMRDGSIFYEFTLYAEPTEKYCEELSAFRTGNAATYMGLDYRLTATESEDGNFRFDVYTVKEGVKYYFTLLTADGEGYLKPLSFIAAA